MVARKNSVKLSSYVGSRRPRLVMLGGFCLFALLMAACQWVPDVQNSADDMIGTVRVNGVDSFDSDSVRHDAADQWRWLTIPGSRLVLNPAQITVKSKPLSRALELNAGYYVGPHPYRLQRLMSMRLLEPGEAVSPSQGAWTMHVSGEDLARSVKDGTRAVDGITVVADKGRAKLSALNPDRPWGWTSIHVKPPFKAQSGTVRIRVAESDGGYWALKVNPGASLGAGDEKDDESLENGSEKTGDFIFDLADADGWNENEGFDLKLFAVYPGKHYWLESIDVTLSPEPADLGQADSVKTAWHPSRIEFKAEYERASTRLSGCDFFYDENTLVRLINVDTLDPQARELAFEGLPYCQKVSTTFGDQILVFEH